MANQATFYFDRVMADLSKTIRLYKLDGYEAKSASCIAKGFLSDVPSLSISNDWGAADSTFISAWVNQIAGMITSPIGKRITETKTAKSIMRAIGLNDKDQADIRAVQNASIKSIENLVKQYNGTTTDIGLSNIKMFVPYDAETPTLDPIGTVKSILDAGAGKFAVDGKAIEALAENGIAGVQFAPNGYEVEYKKALGGDLKGTFILEVGRVFQFRNILIQGINVEFSPYRVGKVSNYEAVWSGAAPEFEPLGEGSPAWAEITLNFTFAREFTMEDYEKMLESRKVLQ